MAKEIKCPKFLSKTNGKFCYINCTNDNSNFNNTDNNVRAQFGDKEVRKKHLMEHCCGDYKSCSYYKRLEANKIKVGDKYESIH